MVDLCLRNLLGMAAMTMIMVDTYARPGEAQRLRRCDFLEPRPGVLPSWAIIIAPEGSGRTTKTGETDDTVMLDSKWLSWAGPLVEALAGDQSSASAWSHSYPEYCAEFRKSCKRLGLKKLVPYQARHSGASCDRAAGDRLLEAIRKRGRWRSHKSLVRYEKAGRLAVSAKTYDAKQAAFFEKCARLLEDVMLGRITAVTGRPVY